MVDFVFNSALGLSEKSGRDFCVLDSDSHQFGLGSSILKHTGSTGAAPVGAKLPTKIYFFKFLLPPQKGKYKIDQSQKLRIAQKETWEYKNSDQNIAHLLK